MKILKVGIDPKAWTTNIKCSSCQSELEIMTSDIKYLYLNESQWDKGRAEFSIDCPVCNRKSVIDTSRVPQLVLTNAREHNKR
jgi:hypothetical protein